MERERDCGSRLPATPPVPDCSSLPSRLPSTLSLYVHHTLHTLWHEVYISESIGLSSVCVYVFFRVPAMCG